MATVMAGPTGTAGSERPVKGGSVAWACHAGFPPSTIFPFTPAERIGIRNLFEFQVLMYRPLYWLGTGGQPGVDFDLSLALPPEWSEDGRTVTVTLKPWRWSNGEPICADNVMFWVNMLTVKAPRYGNYTPGCLPDNLTSYQKVAADKVRFTFDKAYSRTWVLMNQLALITPMPKAWDRTAEDAPASASSGLADVAAVYDYLVRQNGAWDEEDNELRTRWPDSPVWRVVSGPWRLKSFGLDGTVTFVPNEHYCGPYRPQLDEFRQVPISSDEQEYAMLAAGELQVGAVCVRPGTGTGCAGEGIEAGDTLTFRLRYAEGRAALRRLMHQLQADAAGAGIELRLEEVYGSAMVAQDHGESGPDNPRWWELQCWNGGWIYSGLPTGEMLFRTGGGSNFGHYSDPKADELIARVGLSDDPGALHEYQDYLAGQVPVVWMPGFPVRLLEVARNLRGIEPLNPYGMLNPENWYYVED